MPLPAVRFEDIKTNCVSLRVAMKGEGPLCVLVHGWPELWLSWRHQIEPLVEAGYRVADVERAAQVDRKFADLELGIVDASIVAVAERLDVRRILRLTPGRRRWRISRCRSCGLRR